MQGVVLAYSELHRALEVELAVCLQVLDYVHQQVGSLGLNPDKIVDPGSPPKANVRGKGGREGGRERWGEARAERRAERRRVELAGGGSHEHIQPSVA